MKVCTKCKLSKPLDEFYKHLKGKNPRCSVCSTSDTRARAAQVKDAVFASYGGYVCACCGEDEPKFLTIDHVNNDGGAHRRTSSAISKNLYRWLKRNNFPDGFQVLCMNCNLGKARNNGVCPHRSHIKVS